MADKLFKDYFNERQEDNAIQGNTKILIKRGNNVRKIDVDKFATAAQGSLADSAVQPSALGTMAYEDADDYVDLTSNQTIGGVKSFTDNVGIGTILPQSLLHIQGTLNNDDAKIFITESLGTGSYLKYNGITNIFELGGVEANIESPVIRFPRNASSLSLYTTATERVTINNIGNVGIGTTSPAAKLDVDGTAFLRDRVASDYITPYSGNELLMLNGVNNHLTIQGNTKITGTLDLNDGSNRTIVGTQAGGSGALETSLGYQAGQNTSQMRMSNFGYQAGRASNSVFGTFIGYQAGQNSSAGNSTAVGYQAGFFATGFAQTAVGIEAGSQNTGSQNIAVGRISSLQNSGDNVISVGISATRSNSGNNVLALGNNAAQNNTQSNRTIINNDLLPAFASFSLAEAAFGTGQAGMTYLYFNTITNAIEGVRF